MEPNGGVNAVKEQREFQLSATGVLVPKRMFFTNGVGRHTYELRSFEAALRDAGIEKCNIVHVSSIFPPECKVIPRSEGLKEIVPGMITFAVMARASSSEPRRLIAASIGCAIPANRSDYGYLSEHHSFGQNEKEAGDQAEELAAAMLASTLGIEYDERKSWDENEQVFKLNDKVVKTMNVTQSGIVEKGGFTTVVAAAVLLF
jgi:arginine decarboxylase